jgi:hypothetical protein
MICCLEYGRNRKTSTSRLTVERKAGSRGRLCWPCDIGSDGGHERPTTERRRRSPGAGFQTLSTPHPCGQRKVTTVTAFCHSESSEAEQQHANQYEVGDWTLWNGCQPDIYGTAIGAGNRGD